MRRRGGGNSWESLKQLVDLANYNVFTSKNPNTNSNIQVMMYYYTHALGQYKFRYDLIDSQWIGLETIITNVILSYNPDCHDYTLECGDAENLNKYVSNNKV